MLVGGRYETIREMSRGGRGKTYLAQDTYRRGGRNCVVKRIQPQSKLPAVLQKARERFEQEVQALYQISGHTQIPKLFEHLEQNGEFFLIQELVDGHDLRQAFTLGDRWDEKNVINLLREVLEILAFVHEHQVVHGDVNPQNLLRRWRDKRLVLVDFSGTKVIRGLMINAQGEIIITKPAGTAGYMPKEQLEGNLQTSSDIYAVGMMGIQAVTGYSPNQLPRNPLTQEVEWHDQAQITPELMAILDKMVRFDPQERYQSVLEILDALPASSQKSISIALSSAASEPVKPRTYAIVIPPKFRVGRDFSEDLAAVVIEDKLGYIDPNGRLVVEPTFDFDVTSSFWEGAYQFAEGLAQLVVAERKGGKLIRRWGYIDATGTFAIKPQFDSAVPFVAGLARVEVDQIYGYIDPTGQFAIKPQFESAAQSFAEELAGVEIDQRYGFIDKTGAVVIPPQFDSAGSFTEGLARVTLNDKYGFIDKTGSLVIPAEFDVAHSFQQGLARVRVEGRYGYIDQSGKIVIPPQFEDTFSFTEGLALVRHEEQYGYLSQEGKLVIPLQFEDAYPFTEGLAAVKVDNLWGFIDQESEWIIKPQFEDARCFRRGRAAIKMDGLWGYLGLNQA
jgi:serine/threonine-protein kinase